MIHKIKQTYYTNGFERPNINNVGVGPSMNYQNNCKHRWTTLLGLKLHFIQLFYSHANLESKLESATPKACTAHIGYLKTRLPLIWGKTEHLKSMVNMSSATFPNCRMMLFTSDWCTSWKFFTEAWKIFQRDVNIFSTYPCHSTMEVKNIGLSLFIPIWAFTFKLHNFVCIIVHISIHEGVYHSITFLSKRAEVW